VSLPRVLPAALLILAAAALAACGGGGAPLNAAPQAGQPLPADGAIPVEALPDPLPQPYLFRDTAAPQSAPQTEIIYVVQSGDTLDSIAAQFCITTAEIQRLNTIVDVNTLQIGDELRIPIREGARGGAAPAAAAPADDAAAEPEQRPGELYTVQAGDTLADIAASFGFGWEELAAYNNLSAFEADNLFVGQELVIPPPAEPTAEAQAADQADQLETQAAEPEERTEPPG